jgi:flagellar basal-body rod protein FlgB
MELENLGLFKLMARRMGWLTQRQEVLSHNIANADTPNFKPEDMKPFSFENAMSDASRIEMAATAAGHLKGNRPALADRARRERTPYETTPDGNAVVLEEQMLKVGQTSQLYDTVLNLYKKQLSMIQTAVRGSH